MSKHPLVVFANFARDNGLSITEAVKYCSDNYDDLDSVMTDAYECVYEELMHFVNDYSK
jgi:hypothetical protein